MKKIIGITAIVLVIIMGIKGIGYYNDTYKPSLAYTIVPDTIPEKKETVGLDGEKITNSQGQQSYSYDYTFEFKKRNGRTQTINYVLEGVNVKPFKPGSRMTAEISKTRILKGPFNIKD